MCGRGVGPTPASERNEILVMTMREDAAVAVDFINHVVKCQRAAERLGPPNLCVWTCVLLCQGQKCNHKSIYVKDWG